MSPCFLGSALSKAWPGRSAWSKAAWVLQVPVQASSSAASCPGYPAIWAAVLPWICTTRQALQKSQDSSSSLGIEHLMLTGCSTSNLQVTDIISQLN